MPACTPGITGRTRAPGESERAAPFLFFYVTATPLSPKMQGRGTGATHPVKTLLRWKEAFCILI